MNIRRGFFRVWVAASCFWMAFVLVKADVSSEIGVWYRYYFDHEAEQKRRAPDVCSWRNVPSLSDRRSRTPENQMQELRQCIELYQLERPPIKYLVEPLLWAFLPPTLGVACSMLAGYWIFLLLRWLKRGFDN